MKKTYLPPFVEVSPFTIESDILTISFEGKSQADLSICDETEDEDWTF